jgi:hypothetical protein
MATSWKVRLVVNVEHLQRFDRLMSGQPGPGDHVEQGVLTGSNGCPASVLREWVQRIEVKALRRWAGKDEIAAAELRTTVDDRPMKRRTHGDVARNAQDSRVLHYGTGDFSSIKTGLVRQAWSWRWSSQPQSLRHLAKRASPIPCRRSDTINFSHLRRPTTSPSMHDLGPKWEHPLQLPGSVKQPPRSSDISKLTEDMTSGQVSYRKLRKYNHMVDDYNAIWAKFPASVDMRLYDGMPYFAVSGMVTTLTIPPAGVHLNDHGVGALLAMYKGGGISQADLTTRWPAIFDTAGRVYRARRPMGDPFLMKDANGRTVYGQATGRTLLCGAGYKPEDWKSLANVLSKSTPKKSYWVMPDSKGTYLVPSDVPATRTAARSNDNGLLPVLTSDQANSLLKDGRSVFPDLGVASKAINIAWATPDGTRPSISTVRLKVPTQVQAKLDPGDVKADWPSNGRSIPFATLPLQPSQKDTSTESTLADPPRTPQLLKHTAKPLGSSSPYAVRRPANPFSDSDSEDEEEPVDENDQADMEESIEYDSDADDFAVERELVQHCQALEDVGAAMFANSCQRATVDASADLTVMKILKGLFKDAVGTTMDPKARAIFRSIKTATKSWYDAKGHYAAHFDAHVDDQLAYFDSTSAYNTSLTRMNVSQPRVFATSADAEYPDKLPEMDKLKAIFDPSRNSYYEVSREFQATEEYMALTTSHRPNQHLISKEAVLRRYNPDNPNSISYDVDKANGFDRDLIEHLDRETALEEIVDNPFAVREAKHAKQATQIKRKPSPMVEVRQTRSRVGSHVKEESEQVKRRPGRPPGTKTASQAGRGRGRGRGGLSY